MARGRLIWPMLADIRQIDTTATALDPDAGGPLTAGYDDDFREPVQIPSGSGQGPGVENRKELPALLIPCQVEVYRKDDPRATASGKDVDDQIILVMHFATLEDMGLVDSDGRPKLRAGDRLEAILNPDGSLSQRIGNMYLTEPQPNSIGLSARRRNLLLASFKSRNDAPPGV